MGQLTLLCSKIHDENYGLPRPKMATYATIPTRFRQRNELSITVHRVDTKFLMLLGIILQLLIGFLIAFVQKSDQSMSIYEN